MLQGRRRNSDPLLVKSVAKRALFAHLNLLLAEPAAKRVSFRALRHATRGTGGEEDPFRALGPALAELTAKRAPLEPNLNKNADFVQKTAKRR